MDASSLLFVALAVAWAAYLIPKALHAHDDGERTRSVDRFSHRMRVLARREPTSRRGAELVVTASPAARREGPPRRARFPALLLPRSAPAARRPGAPPGVAAACSCCWWSRTPPRPGSRPPGTSSGGPWPSPGGCCARG
ncbi:MAG: hypothetical protein R2734_17830 [Nocardioides sp.]